MRLTIFSRMVIGYLVIFLLVIGMSIYAVVRIGQFNEVTQSVLMTNNRMIDYAGKLSDSLLSQIRYERKFIITRDGVFYNEFSRLKRDFEQYLREVMAIADTPQVLSMLNSVKDSYHTYQSLFNEEMKYQKDGISYSPQLYKKEKDRVTNGIIEGLENVRTTIQQNTTDKIKKLYEAGTDARRMAILMTGAFLVLGIAISFFINRSITQPISVMKKKTKEIAQGDFKRDLNFSSPPELAELAGAFNLMCNMLNELDKMKSDFFSSVDQGVEVSVADTGHGIPAENLTTIFEKFRQATHQGSSHPRGTGMGLAMAKQIVTHHGGKIWAESEPGRGSTFIFVLPA